MSTAEETIITDSMTRGTCLLLVLSKPRAAARSGLLKVDIRPIALREGNRFQFTSHFSDRVTHENLVPRQAAESALRLLRETFEHAAVYTTEADYAVRQRPDGTFKVKRSAATRSSADASHNRQKSYLIPEGIPCPFLAEIGVMTAEGQVRRAMYHKFRQINRFLELVNDVVPELTAERELRVVDFGCGKSYLTFALHHLLTVVHRRRVQIVGLDCKSDVIRDCTGIAGRLGCTGLEFREGDIATHVTEGPVDLAVSLHACDTATDAALAQAMRWNTGVILSVPCCQHELAPQIRSDALQPILRHGILHERFAALATDALRALLLEAQGYSVQITEFIDLEHTPKNILIRAVRNPNLSDAWRDSRQTEYLQLSRMLGIESMTLEQELAGRSLRTI